MSQEKLSTEGDLVTPAKPARARDAVCAEGICPAISQNSLPKFPLFLSLTLYKIAVCGSDKTTRKCLAEEFTHH